MKKILLKDLIPPWNRNEVNMDKIVRDAYNNVTFSRELYITSSLLNQKVYSIQSIESIEYTGEKPLTYTCYKDDNPYSSAIDIVFSRHIEPSEKITLHYYKPCRTTKYTIWDSEWLEEPIIEYIKKKFIEGSQPFLNIKNKHKGDLKNGKN